MKRLSFFVAAMMTLSAHAANPTNPYSGNYYRLFTPLTFYHSVAQSQLGLQDSQDEMENCVSSALMHVYMKRPDLVSATESDMQESGQLRDDLSAPIKQQVSIVKETAPEPEMLPEADPVEVLVEKPKFWTRKGDGYVQFMQNYVSDNWYKGGESNYAAVAQVVLEANYDNKQRFKWDNKLEMKLGFQTSPSDTVNKFKTNEDLIRLTSKVGLQAINRWYYTLQVQAWTQFYHGLKANNTKVFSDFMSPFNLNAGLGMDYKVEAFNKRLTGTVNMSPIAVNYLYVDRADLAKSFGVKLEDGHTHSLVDFGSQLTANVEWKMNDVVTWKSRLYAYTSYHRALLEWENTFELRVSKYITANLFVFPRLDDSNNPDDELGYWQFKEYSSLGFSYTF
ncbi:MAG: DUF3078 domain-containing protein [Prevotella sp.]|jgi:hypothetical protein|nr:DUF3078 domain-containing protein [Prevotella sp.]